ncbi:NADPH:quinone oxidoreductase family protein [Nocardia niigatensis]|uniref:NADPH:quinone oxidoreductase family protein n=1 Tax=Nocardia niigatensis TaxID=209249 RepID=UPI0002E4BFF2|nr:NADPH:quinone oxidoreductase family protein [Nocardia niigatensis]
MRAIALNAFNGPESFEVIDAPEPDPAGRVVIDVHGGGIAYPELLISRNLYQYKPQLPFIAGSELSGVVRHAPPESGLRPGQAVAAVSITGGSWAETVSLPAEFVVPLPDSIPLTAGAGLLFNDLTVHFALVLRGRLATGETVLVHGAAGGVGSSAVRMAKALGAGRVIGVVSTEAKRQFALEAGADIVVLETEWPDAVRAAGGRVDVVLDPVGGRRMLDSLRLLASGGRYLVIGFTAGDIPEVKVNRLLLNNLDVVGVTWGGSLMSSQGLVQEQWKQLEPLYASGAIAPPAVTVYAAHAVARAASSIEGRNVTGKAVVLLAASAA